LILKALLFTSVRRHPLSSPEILATIWQRIEGG
jgi:hypothetical protein